MQGDESMKIVKILIESEGNLKAKVTTKGYTNVVLVLNMKRFIAEKDRKRFERLRGTKEFANILRDIWPGQALRERTVRNNRSGKTTP